MTNPLFGWPQFDPSKMDPKVLMELSALFQQLSPEQMNKLQMLMHNMMAGFDVKRELEEFERGLPPGFREKMLSIIGPEAAMSMAAGTAASPSSAAKMDLDLARITILRGVAQGNLSPEEALKLLFPEG